MLLVVLTHVSGPCGNENVGETEEILISDDSDEKTMDETHDPTNSYLVIADNGKCATGVIDEMLLMEVNKPENIPVVAYPVIPLGMQAPRRSFCFVTGRYTWEGLTRHANGATFNFLSVYDGKYHRINLTGYIEVEFAGGGDPFNPVVMIMPVTLFWPDIDINYLHFYLDYAEDGHHIRIIDRTFYGNWD